MARDMILIIDMQKVYLPGNPWGCESMETALANILKLLTARGEKEALFFTRFLADPAAEGVWERYNAENREINGDAEMNALLPELLPYIKEGQLYDKAKYSSFSVPNLRSRGKELAAGGARIVLCGVVAECCVLSTFFEAVDLGLPVIYLTDAVAGVNPETEGAVRKILEGLMPLHGRMMTTEEYLREREG